MTSSRSFSGLTTTTCPYTNTSSSIYPTSTTDKTLTELPFICKQFQYWVSDTSALRPALQLRDVDLGVTMALDLSWTNYILDITSKARQKAAWVLSVFHSRSLEIMLTLGKSMIRSLLEYCCLLWSTTKVTDIQELENFNNKK